MIQWYLIGGHSFNHTQDAISSQLLSSSPASFHPIVTGPGLG
jgi:hypothetical protein